MTREATGLAPEIADYLRACTRPEHPVLARLREETGRRPDASLQISLEQGQFMALLVELIGARRILEVGCYTGYSALSMALAMPAGGHLITLDVNEDTTAIARRAWQEAGVDEQIELRLGLALDSLERLLADGAANTFDLAFIDADKKHYDAYFERAFELTRAGGLILLDNMLWHGAVADPADRDRQTETIRALNARLSRDPSVTASLLPIADGLSVVRKR